MPEPQSGFLKKLIRPGEGFGDEPKAFTSERQHTAQAFTLHVEWKDGRHTEGFAWAHYSGYRWLDIGDCEKLLLIFGPRALEIEGHNLGVLVTEIRDGQLNSIREMPTVQQKLLGQSNEENQPIISAVRAYPDIEDILKQIKGDDDDEVGFARRLER
jgi:hypothetical protein